jgi:hypothetical protein
MDDLPDSFISTILRVFGDAGRAWLDDFPSILERCRARWALTLGEPIPNLSVNYITSAVTGAGEEVMLKIAVMPHEVRATSEKRASPPRSESSGFITLSSHRPIQ